MGEGVFECFNTLVFLLSTDPYNLYDDEYGIIKNYEGRGREFERPVYIELIDYNGQPLIQQNGGIRIMGGASRKWERKPFRLIARRLYEPEIRGTFDFNFFPDDESYDDYPITDYKRLSLKNYASTPNWNILRDVVVSELSASLVLDSQANRPALVFLNGEYYSFTWIREVYSQEYFYVQNGMNSREANERGWVVLEGGDAVKPPDADFPAAAEEYTAMYDLYKEDINNETVFNALNEQMDVDNFLLHYAVGIYTANNDWPKGNSKAYRYYGAPDMTEDQSRKEMLSSTDGRWRALLYDNDVTMGHPLADANDPTLSRVIGASYETAHSPMFSALMERQDTKMRFVTYMCDLMNHFYSPERVKEVTTRRFIEQLNNLNIHFRFEETSPEEIAINLASADDSAAHIIFFGNERPAIMRSHIEECLNIGSIGYHVNVEAHNLADIRLSTIDITEDFTGFYYDICELELNAYTPPGYAFSHWLVNGKERYEKTLILGKDDKDLDDYISVKLVLREDVNAIPVISIIDYEEKADYIEVFNPYESNIDLSKYFITDDPADPFKQLLAGRILRPGESINIYCNNYRREESLGAFALDFSLKSGETLLITDMYGVRAFEYTLPKMDNAYVLVMNMRNGWYTGVLR